MKKPNIVETYVYEDGPVVHIADDAYRGKTPEELRVAWKTAQAAAFACLEAGQSGARPEPEQSGDA
ncbi:MAG: hypothetical protein ACOX8O_03755 [Christensenellales bacterium]